MNEQERVIAQAHANLDRLRAAIDTYAAVLVTSLEDRHPEPGPAAAATSAHPDIPMPVLDLATNGTSR